MPIDVITRLYDERADLSDQEILKELQRLQPLPDENHPAWDEEWDKGYAWHLARLFVALSWHVVERKLIPGIELLLERACFGDPGEMMRGLEDLLYGTAEGDFSVLIPICNRVAKSERPGTRFWAITAIGVL
jgi:hypothetical protein